MPIELVKEDGSLVTGANTYVSNGDLITFGALRGVTVVDADATSIALVQAMDLLSTFADQFIGERCSALQALDWPRTRYYDSSIPGCPVPINPVGSSLPYAMPKMLLAAQSFAALAALSGTVLQPTVTTDGFVAEEKIGPISTTYQKGVDYSNQPRIPTFMAALQTIIERRAFLTVGRA